MIKLLTLCDKNTPDCIKVKGGRCFIEKEYSVEEYKIIRAEADKYEIYVLKEWGYDYGYGQEESSKSESTRAIKDCQIVVSKDGLHFAGVADISDYYGFNKVSNYDNNLKITLCNDPADRWASYPLVKKTGSSFSSDDHSKWDYTYCYLRRKRK